MKISSQIPHQQSNFPILAQLQKDCQINQTPFVQGDRIVFKTPEDIPSGVAIVVIQTRYKASIDNVSSHS